MNRTRMALFVVAVVLMHAACVLAADVAPPDFTKHVRPILNKYCAGCHNDQEREGDLVMDTYADLMRGGELGADIKPGDAAASRLIQVLTGAEKPKMPPKDKPAPSADEIEVLRRWIAAGAKGPVGDDVPTLDVPDIAPAANGPRAVTAAAFAPDGRRIAVARYGAVELLEADTLKPVRTFTGLPGKVNALHFSRDGQALVAATGVVGLYGRAVMWNAQDGSVIREITGHRDAMYDAVLSPDDTLLATCSYDRRIILWNAATGDEVRTITGHNDAVYDLAFGPDAHVLASASGDQTVKLWRVADGERLDTLHQPTAEQYAVAFSPDGHYVLAGGADNRIRVWRVVSRTEPAINPLVYARFAHEGAIIVLAYTGGGDALVSAADDGTLKLWETGSFTQIHDYDPQPDVPAALAASPRKSVFVVGRMDGSLHAYGLSDPASDKGPRTAQGIPLSDIHVSPLEWPDIGILRPVTPGRPAVQLEEREPNDSPDSAQSIEVPAVVTGVIHNPVPGASHGDADLFRFEAKAGQQWVLEVNAARSKSPLDSKLEVVDADGARITRVLLQAVRDSYFTFRGKDSDTSDDFRVRNWEEMELNEYLYANGEVVKLWHYPRGPDSGFMVYPGSGKRHGQFDTTPLSHPLHEPAYIVRPYPANAAEQIVPNGLPVFPIYFENDDESTRRLGADSKLTFTAPRDGSYLARISDVRGFHGGDYRYELTIRPRRPDFKVSVEGVNPEVGAGSGREFTVKAERIDDYAGEIRVDIEGVPPGFSVTTPVVIEAGQESAVGVISADADAPKPTADNAKATKVTATAVVNGEPVTKDAGSLGEIKLIEKPKLLVTILPADGEGSGGDVPFVLSIAPGQTIEARVRVERNGFEGRVEFGNADAGRNTPHGVYVDNIGLNGLLVVEGQTERSFFITAAKWVRPTERWFHLRAKPEGGQASRPVMLRVIAP